ncbi:MAG: DUF5717 family protein [Velocimicrobium sp.]
MKEKMRQLAKEEFEYELPHIFLSEETIQITVEAGKTFIGKVVISNSEQKDMKGIVYTFVSNLKITNPMFIGATNEVRFLYDAKKEVSGRKINGKIYIVSNCGEMSVSVKIVIVKPYIATSIGKIKDLFHFANLAHSNWEEAVNVFESPDFERVLLKEEELKALYYGLLHGIDHNTSLEEFLIQIQKKNSINFQIDRVNCTYQNPSKNFMDQIIIEKDNWGYQSFRVTTDCDFIAIEKDVFTTKNFVGNSYALELLIETDKLRVGNHYGTIYLHSKVETKEVHVLVQLSHPSKEHEKNRKRKELLLIFTQNYLNLRTNQIAYDKYITDLVDLVKHSKDVLSYWSQKLLELHYYIMDHHAGVETLFREMEEQVEAIKEDSLLSYTTYLYLRALYSKKEELINEASSFIGAYYENGFDSWQLLWFLLYLDDQYQKNPEKKWEVIAHCIDVGANSPILFYEACICLESDRKARVYFQKSLHKILAFGIKTNCLSNDLKDLFCFLSEQEGKVLPWIMNGLYLLYETTRSKEVLYTICKLLIQNKKKEQRYFKWFQKGEKEKLKIENLYEYYIYTMQEDFSLKIPTNLILFFQYDNQLSFEKKAFFYAYLIKNKNHDMGSFVIHEKMIRKFAREALKQEKINRNLAILYEEFFQLDDVDERISLAFCKIMFRHELQCDNSKMVGVYVSHKELLKEVYTPLINGTCYIDIFTENPCIIFVDAKGNRFLDMDAYKIVRLFHIHGLSLKCYQYCKNNYMLMLNIFEKIFKYQKQNENSVFVQRRCVLLPTFKDYYKGQCYETLIQYYFDNMETEALTEMLLLSDFNLLRKEFRPNAIYYCMIYDLKDKASFMMSEYGFEGIPINRLIHFCTEEIKIKGMDIKNKFLLDMAYFIFCDGKYNESILTYLILYLEGDSETLLKLWKSCINFDLDAYVLEERILSQVLFTEEQVMKAMEAFKSYYKKGGDETIVRAYLAYTSYKYLINERIACEDLFPIMKKEVFYEESRVGTLALLSYFSKKQTLLKEELAFSEQAISSLTKLGYIFPFYKDFSGKIKLPQQIKDYFYVSYRCNPKKRVRIHYMLAEDDSQADYITKCMKNTYYGIHVIPFLLFKDETLQYYITEDDGSEEIITESIRIDGNRELELEESKFGLINLMLTAKEMKDEKTLLELMEMYIKCNYVEQELIKIL